jgi:hypothetical protein
LLSLAIVCALAVINRTNLGATGVAGMRKDSVGLQFRLYLRCPSLSRIQKLTVGDRYSFVSAIYFVPNISLYRDIP